MKANSVLRSAIVVLSSLVCGGAPAQTLYEKGKKDEITIVPNEDAAMAVAFRKARASLDQFFAIARRPPPNTDHFSVKVAVSDGRNTEYFWVGDFRGEGDMFTGRLDNEPRVVHTVKLGERIRFRRSDIVDWTYLDVAKPRMHGNFTLCAMLTKEAPTERERHKRAYGLECDG